MELFDDLAQTMDDEDLYLPTSGGGLIAPSMGRRGSYLDTVVKALDLLATRTTSEIGGVFTSGGEIELRDMDDFQELLWEQGENDRRRTAAAPN